MVKKKDGFLGERSVILPPMYVDMERKDPLVRSLYITDIGYYPMAEHHHRIRTEGINQYVLIYCVDGSGFYRLKGNTFDVARNQYFILPANVPHEYGATEGGQWTIYWVHFQGEHSSIYAEGADIPQDVRVSINSNIHNRNNIFEEILTTLNVGNGIEDLRYATSLLHYYLASLRYLRQYRRTSHNEEDTEGLAGVKENGSEVVDAAIHFMQENIERRITMKDILHYVGYSSTRFSFLFKEQTGSSPLAYFNHMKIEYACRMMRETNLKINQICYKLGIEDSLYFSRMFSKAMGMSPSEYKKNYLSIELKV